MHEPTTAIFHRQTTFNTVLTYLAATRPMFFTASLLPVVTAFAWIWRQYGAANPPMMLAITFSVVCIHAAANVLNDYFDARNGADAQNRRRLFPFSGGSRFIQNGVLGEREMLHFGIGLLGAGVAAGLVVALNSGPWIWLIGLTGVLLAWFYSAPPCLSCHGLGDIVIATCFGVLPVVGTLYALTGVLDPVALWLGLAIGCFVAAILWVNSVPDIEADLRAGKRTLPARLGERLALRLHGLWFVAGFLAILAAPLPDAADLVLLAAIPAGVAASAAWKGRLMPAIPLTIVTHAMVCLLLALGLLL